MSGQIIRVLVVDDHDIVHRGIRHLLLSKLRYQIVGEALSGSQALGMARVNNPNVVILDDTLPNEDSLTMAIDLKRVSPKLEILLFATNGQESQITRAIEAGISGFVLKSEKEASLIAALDAVSSHRPYFSSVHGGVRQDGRSAIGLTPRERDVIALITNGAIHKRVAEHLGIGIKTVETHRSNAMNKLGIRRTADLVRYAMRNGLIPD